MTKEEFIKKTGIEVGDTVYTQMPNPDHNREFTIYKLDDLALGCNQAFYNKEGFPDRWNFIIYYQVAIKNLKNGIWTIKQKSFDNGADKDKYPHTCSRCNNPSYNGLNSVDCSNPNCPTKG